MDEKELKDLKEKKLEVEFQVHVLFNNFLSKMFVMLLAACIIGLGFMIKPCIDMNHSTEIIYYAVLVICILATLLHLSTMNDNFKGWHRKMDQLSRIKKMLKDAETSEPKTEESNGTPKGDIS